MDGTNIGPYFPATTHPHPRRQQKSPAWGQANWKKHMFDDFDDVHEKSQKKLLINHAKTQNDQVVEKYVRVHPHAQILAASILCYLDLDDKVKCQK